MTGSFKGNKSLIVDLLDDVNLCSKNVLNHDSEPILEDALE